MKKIILFSMVGLLSGCDSLLDNSSAPSRYDYNDTNPRAIVTTPVTTTVSERPSVAKRSEVTATTLGEPGSTAVVTPKLTDTSKSLTGPTVPGMAPTIGQ